MLIVIIVAVTSITGNSSSFKQYITLVQTGYLGDYFDSTISDIFASSMPKGMWDGGETSDGEKIVEYKWSLDNENTILIQFTILDDNNFKVSAMELNGSTPSNDTEMATLIQSRYIQYFSSKDTSKASADSLSAEPVENILIGVSRAYADKAKNPIDISMYFDKSKEETTNVLGLSDKDGILENSDVALTYDGDKIHTVYLRKSRIYSLFGIQSTNQIEDAKIKIADQFTYVSEQQKDGNLTSVMFIRNGNEDSLTITYDINTGTVSESVYVVNGLMGYRAEQERLQAEQLRLQKTNYKKSREK